MALKRLEARHYKAISYLILPDNGGLTFDEIAEQCGVSRKSLWQWRNDETFDREYKKQIKRHYGDRLPELMEAGIQQALEGQGKHLELMLKAIGGMLTDDVKIEQTVKSEAPTDVDALKAKAADLLARYGKTEEKAEDTDKDTGGETD